MLSNADIKKELGKNILIYPFDLNNIRGASINLTASKCAWSLKTKRTIVNNNTIVIPAHDTALIETEECLWVSKRIAGTYHSKVTLVSNGISHIGTTLDPEWIGNSLIAMTNNTDNPIEIKCGDSFVSVCFYYLATKSTFPDSQNNPGRTNLLLDLGIQETNEDKEFFAKEWKTNIKTLRSEMEKSDSYKEFVAQKKSPIKIFKRNSPIIICAVAWLALFIFKEKIPLRIGGLELWELIIIVGASGFLGQIVSAFRKKV